MFRHVKISSTNYVNGLLEGREFHTIVSYYLCDNKLHLKVQKGRLTINGLYFLICELLKTNEEIRKSLSWVPTHTMRGTYVRQRYSGACDHYITFKDDWNFIHKKLVIHTTMNGYIESEFGKRNEASVFLPDLLLLMLNNDFQLCGNEMIVKAIKGQLADSNKYINHFDLGENDNEERTEEYTYSEIKEEDQNNQYCLSYVSDITAYVNNMDKVEEPVIVEESAEVVGE